MEEKRYESDLTARDKRQLEREKLKKMNVKQKIEYIWQYYKFVFVILLGIVCAVAFSAEIYHNAQIKTVLSIAVVDSTGISDEAQDKFNQGFQEYIGMDNQKEMVSLDTTMSSSGGYTSSIKMTTLMASGSLDVLICDKETYETYLDQGAFMDWADVLGDEYQKYSSYITEDKKALKLDESKTWMEAGITEYSPVYAGVVISAVNLENAKNLVRYLFNEV